MADPYAFADVAAALREIERRRLEGESSDDEMTPAIQQVARAMGTQGQWPGAEPPPADGGTPEGWSPYRAPEYLSQYNPTLRDKTAGVLLDWGAPRSFVEGTVGSMGAGRQGGMPLVDFAGATPFALDEYQRATAFPTREQLERSPGGPGMGNVFGPGLDIAAAIPIPGAKAAAEALKTGKSAVEGAADVFFKGAGRPVAEAATPGAIPRGVLFPEQEMDLATRAKYMTARGASPEDVHLMTGLTPDAMGNWITAPAAAAKPSGAREAKAAAKAEAAAAVEAARVQAAATAGRPLGVAKPEGIGAGSVDWSKVTPVYPEGFSSPQHFNDQYEKYFQYMTEGREAHPWYSEVGKTNLALTGGDVLRAQKNAAFQGATSWRTGVRENQGSTIAANNQAAVGEPIFAGRYPNIMSPQMREIEGSTDVEGAASPLAGLMDWRNKERNFSRNIMIGGGYGDAGPEASLSVNDMWQLKALGYSDKQIENASKTPGIHLGAWNMMHDILPEANKRGVGGHVDWDPISGQAAGWSGVQSVEAGIPTGTSSKSYMDFNKDYQGSQAWEVAPHPSLQARGVMPGYENLPWEYKAAHRDEVMEALKNPYGGDAIITGMGGLAPPMHKGFGVFSENGKLSINPNVISPILLGRETVEKGGLIGKADARLSDATDAARALALGQGAFATTLKGNPGASPSVTRITDFDLGRPLTDEDMLKVVGLIDKHMTEVRLTKNGAPVVLGGSRNIVPKNTENGFELFLHNNGDDVTPEMQQAFAKASAEIEGALGANRQTNHQALARQYGTQDWSQQGAPQAYMSYLEGLGDNFDRTMPVLMPRLREIAASVQKDLGGPAKNYFDEVLATIGGGGSKGLMDAIKKGALSVGAVGTVLGVVSQILDEEEGGGGQTSATRVY